MSNIEVGEYIRTKDGYIAKCTDTDGDYTKLYWFNSKIDKISGIPVYDIHEEQLNNIILKHSKNIIDLIEVGDYVNGNIVYELLDDEIELLAGKIRKKRLHFITGHLIDEEEIKSIVTKEQFKEMEYRVDE